MNVTHIVQGIHTAPYGLPAAQSAARGGVDFAALLKEALGQISGTEAADRLGGLRAVAGQSEDIHSLTIAAQKAEIALNLTLQIRNKLMEAYQEIMRMQV